jgi:dynactin-4
MSVNTLDSEKSSILHGPWILACGYCNWTSLDIGVQFDKAMNLYAQIYKLKGRGSSQTLPPSRHVSTKDEVVPDSEPSAEPEATFSSLKSFYKSQLSASTPSNPLLTPAGELNYNSPSSLARLMSLYTGIGSYGKKNNTKSQEMRESANQAEGLRLIDPLCDTDAVQKLRTQGWSGTASLTQRAEQIHPPRFVDDLLPVPTLLRTKRNKRCGNCRHILVKPEAKVQSTRFRIKLVAVNYIPNFTIKPLRSPPQPAVDLNSIVPKQANQFLLTVRNATYETFHITLATPTHTPGLHGHKVTILCPEFDLGPNIDMWEEALTDDERVHMEIMPNPKPNDFGGDGRVAEAGKIWEQGRDWTTIVLEVVCVDIWAKKRAERERGLEEDEDVLEIPIFVRMEWMGDEPGDEIIMAAPRIKVKREMAYWVVLGVGRIASSSR